MEELQPYQKELLEWKGQGFDNRVHIVDPKTGKLLKHQPYRYVVDREGNYYIRDGKRYDELGRLLDPEPEPHRPRAQKDVKGHNDPKLS